MNKINELSKRQKNEEKILVANALDKVRFSNERNTFQYRSFLDLSEQMLIKKAFEMRKIENYELFGGYKNAERKMLLIYPKEHIENIKNLEEYKKIMRNEVIGILRITLPKELHGTYDHRTYLGALMKLRLERKKIGDIIVRFDGADIIICRDVEAFLNNNVKDLTRFQKSKIEFVTIDELNYVEAKKEIIKINVTSMRLDCLIAELARCSRSEANKLIEQERIFVDFKEELVPSRKIEENTYITIRGKGRFKILGVKGTTKSGRLAVEVEK